MGRGRRALGRRELSPTLGPGVGFPGVRGPRAAMSASTGSRSGRPAQLPRAPGAGAACPGPVGLGLRAAGRREENNRRGGREREERERGTRGPTPPGPAPSAGGPTARGPLGPRDQERAQAPGPGGSPAHNSPPLPLRAARAPARGRVTPGDPAAGLFAAAGRASRHQRPNGWASRASAPRPY